MELKRTNYSSGAPLEEKVGYSRMVKAGPFVYIGGTTSVQPDGTVFGDNAYDQTRYVLLKQIKLLEQLKASITENGMTVEKEYVKGRVNIVINPAITEYNKTASAANQTVQTLIKIVQAYNDGADMSSAAEDDEM